MIAHRGHGSGMNSQLTTFDSMLQGPSPRESASGVRVHTEDERSFRDLLADAGTFVVSSLRKIGEYFNEGVHHVRMLFARSVGKAALGGVEVEGSDGAIALSTDSGTSADTPPDPRQVNVSGIWRDEQFVPSNRISFSPTVTANTLSRYRLTLAERAERSVLLKMMFLEAKAREVWLMREQGDPDAPSDDELLAYFMTKAGDEWHWDDDTINRAFDAFSRVLYPDAMAVHAVNDDSTSVAAAALGAQRKPETASSAMGAEEPRRDPRRWILAGALGLVTVGGALIGLNMISGDRPLRPVVVATSPAPTPVPTVTQRPQTPTPENNTGGGGTNNQDKKPIVQTKLKGAEADKKGDFVSMTSYADRHEARANGADFSTVWWIVREQLDAVNGSAIPTNHQIWEFTDQTLDHNRLTWDEARRLREDHKIRLLSDSAAQAVLRSVR